jgi:hypothetical protein
MVFSPFEVTGLHFATRRTRPLPSAERHVRRPESKEGKKELDRYAQL